MIILDSPENIFRIKLIKIGCNDIIMCPFRHYDSFVKRYTVCNLKEPYFVRRTRIDKNGRISLDPNSKPMCCIKILDDNEKGKDVPYASSEIEYMKKIIK